MNVSATMPLVARAAPLDRKAGGLAQVAGSDDAGQFATIQRIEPVS